MKHKIIINSLLICLFAIMESKAQTLFSQHRVIYEKNGIMSMFLSNPTEKTYTYKIMFEDKEMDRAGNVFAVPNDKLFKHSLKQYLRVFPRNVIVVPGNSQEVQIQLKTPESLPYGEYRSFITFFPLDENNDSRDSINQGTQIAVKYQIAASIPIIYRKNAVVGQATIDSVGLTSVNDSIKLLNFCIQRDGNRSIYGKLNVIGYIKGIPFPLFTSKSNVVMYCEIPSLAVSVPVNLKSVDRAPDGKVYLDVVYTDNEDSHKREPFVLVEKRVGLIVPEMK